MKVLDLGYEKRWEKFLIRGFSAVFHNLQETKTCFAACDKKPDFTQLRRTVHISKLIQVYNVYLYLLKKKTHIKTRQSSCMNARGILPAM